MMKMIDKIMEKVTLQFVKKSRLFGTKIYMRMYTKFLQHRGAQVDNYEGDGFFAPTVFFDNSDYKLLSIGAGTTIASDVLILTHDYSIRKALNYVGLNPEKKNYRFLKPVIIGRNVFIGARTTILPGVTLGDNTIIAAGSVVKGKVPANTVWGGYQPNRYVLLNNMQ